MTTKIEKKTGIILKGLNTKCLILIIALIAVMLTACKDDDEDEPKYTGVTLGGTIQIWAEAGVDFELAKSLAEGAITDAWNVIVLNKVGDDFISEVEIIYIDNSATGKGLASIGYIYKTESEKKVLRISPSSTAISSIFNAILNGVIELAHLPSPDTIRLANSNWLNTVGIKQT